MIVINSVDLNYHQQRVKYKQISATDRVLNCCNSVYSIRFDCVMYFPLCLEFNLLHLMWGHFNCWQKLKSCLEGKFGYWLTASMYVWMCENALKKTKTKQSNIAVQTVHECYHFVTVTHRCCQPPYVSVFYSTVILNYNVTRMNSEHFFP